MIYSQCIMLFVKNIFKIIYGILIVLVSQLVKTAKKWKYLFAIIHDNAE